MGVSLEGVARQLGFLIQSGGTLTFQDLGAPTWTSALSDRIRRKGSERATAGEWLRFALGTQAWRGRPGGNAETTLPPALAYRSLVIGRCSP